jgi:hypothetical protein
MTKTRADRQRNAAGCPSLTELDAKIAAIESLTLNDLRKAWSERFGGVETKIRSRSVLLRELTWNMQANAFGGFDTGTQRRLEQITDNLDRGEAVAANTRRALPPGVVLTREWKGVVHTVTVTADGFQHLGRRYRSLSDIARSITGTQWSGPRFFGLEPRASRNPREGSR